MKHKNKKELQIQYAKLNINNFFNLLDKRFYPDYDKIYIKEIQKLSQGFNIRLTREQKLKFCKKCNTYMDSNTKEIRFNPKTKTKDHICKICQNTKKFRYK
jgi:RNase P subunit RPR2